MKIELSKRLIAKRKSFIEPRTAWIPAIDNLPTDHWIRRRYRMVEVESFLRKYNATIKLNEYASFE